MIHYVKVILMLLKNISHQKILRHSSIPFNLQWLSIIKQIEVVKELVLPEVFKLNDSVMNKNQRDQIQFSPEKKLYKKENGFVIISVFAIYYHTDKQTNNILF